MSFAKILKAIVQEIKTSASRAIKNDLSFMCHLINPQIVDQDDILYPSYEELNEWMLNLFNVELKPKTINEKALKAMGAKGVKPSKQPFDILLIVVSGSETHVHVGFSIPDTMDELKAADLVARFMKDKQYESQYNNNIAIASYFDESPLKEKDMLRKHIFDVLKDIGINNVADEEDPEIYDFDI